MNANAVIIKDKIYVPTHLVDVDKLHEKYTRRLYEEAVCRKCEFLSDRHSYQCDVCPAYTGAIRLTKVVEKKGIEYIGLPVGDKHNFEKKTGLLLDELEIIDKRVKAPFDYKIKFTAKLREYQIPVVNKFLKKKYGLIEAPPRTGKSIMMLYSCIKLGQKFVILANQHEFLTQFLDHIHGNEKEGIPKCTNLPELEKKYGKKLYGFPKTDDDYKNFQIFTMTYQQFISEKNGKKRLKKLAKHVGTLGIDEVHKANSDKFASVVSMLPCRYKMGVTGTVERKDRRHFIAKALIGPVVARSKREALTPTVYVHETGVKPNRPYTGGKAAWVRAMQFLAKNKLRNEFILKYVLKDLKAGHSIVIPVYFKNHAFTLQKIINEACGKNICEVFVGGGSKKNKDKRREILAKAKAGKIKVVVGIRSLLQLGLNVPQWSAIYTAMPISNEPNYKQETSRVRTPLEGKKNPIIRIFLDSALGQSLGCARNCLKQAKKFGYVYSSKPKQRELIYNTLSSSRRQYDPDDEFKPVRTLDKKVPSSKLFR